MLRAATSIHAGYHLLNHMLLAVSASHLWCPFFQWSPVHGPWDASDLAVHNRPDSNPKWLVVQVVPEPLKVRPRVYLHSVLSPALGAGGWPEVENFFLLPLRPLFPPMALDWPKKRHGRELRHPVWIPTVYHLDFSAPNSSIFFLNHGHEIFQSQKVCFV